MDTRNHFEGCFFPLGFRIPGLGCPLALFGSRGTLPNSGRRATREEASRELFTREELRAPQSTPEHGRVPGAGPAAPGKTAPYGMGLVCVGKRLLQGS